MKHKLLLRTKFVTTFNLAITRGYLDSWYHTTQELKWWKVLILDNFSLITTYRLDALVLRVSEAKAWGTSIYSYVEASRHVSLLIDLCRACVLSVQSTMWSGGSGHVGSTPKLPVCGDPAVGYVVATVAIEVWALRCRPYADCFLYD